MSGSAPCYLLELPGELRSLVFAYLFQDARISFSQAERQPGPMLSEKREWLVIRHNVNISILATCNLIRQEAYPIFWNAFDMFIPSDFLLESRDTGLWSHPRLQKMTSLRPQVLNISIGVRSLLGTDGSLVNTLTMVTCFVTDLKYYSNLKRLTLITIDRGADLQRACPSLTDEGLYENLSDRERLETWNWVKSYLQLSDRKTLRRLFPFWDRLWRQVYSLIMSWRSDPIKSTILSDITYNALKRNGPDPTASMTFRVYHQSYQQLQFKIKGSEWSTADLFPGPLAEMPPLIHEAEVHELGNNDGFALDSMQLIGEHRAFWQQVDPPKRLCDVRNSPSLSISYPFWIEPLPKGVIDPDRLYVM